MQLRGERVLVTGGSSGIGQAIAHFLLAKGAKVVVTGRRPDVLAAAVKDLASGGLVRGAAADVGTAASRAATLAQALDTLGGLDILVNNAKGFAPGGSRTPRKPTLKRWSPSISSRQSCSRVRRCRRSAPAGTPWWSTLRQASC